MLAIDVMTTSPVTATPDTPVIEIARLMLTHHCSAVLIVDAQGQLVGLVTEGDLLRRYETGTERKRSFWKEGFMGSDMLAAEYVKTHAQRAADVMTCDVVTVDESTSLQKIADLFESRSIKRVPVMREKRLVGVVSRANLLQALVCAVKPGEPAATDDRSIRTRLTAELQSKRWRPSNIIVANGVVHFWGEVHSENERKAMRVAAESVPGVRAIEDHTWYPAIFPLP
jgi:CBS domain-containing protein